MKLFVCSDIHGFYSEFKDSLKKSGYDKNNPNHKLIILGDFFDRGSEAKLVKDFIMKEKAVLIRGNHDDSLMRLYETGYIKRHDYTGGTFNTMEQLGEADSGETNRVLADFRLKNKDLMDLYYKMPYYYIVKDILFVHSWVPNVDDIVKATRDEWHSATLTSLSKKVDLVKFGGAINLYPYTNIKTIVFGHHKADDICGMENYDGNGVYTEAIKMLKTKNLTLYGVDGRVEETGKIPVLVLEV